MTLLRLLDAYRWFYAGFIIVASAQTALLAHGHMAILGSVEILAVILFLIHRTRLISGSSPIRARAGQNDCGWNEPDGRDRGAAFHPLHASHPTSPRMCMCS